MKPTGNFPRTLAIAKAVQLLLSLLFLAACSGQKTPEKPQKQSNPVFSGVEIPVLLASPEAQAKYLAVHYWDRFNFSDTTGAWRTRETEEVFAAYLHVLRNSPGAEAGQGIRSMLQRSLDADTAKFNWFTKRYDQCLNDPNSPFRNEELYIHVLEFITTSGKIDPIQKVRPAYQLRMALKNRVGTVAADFSFTDRSGLKRHLSGFHSKYTLLCFYNPGCHACGELKKQMASSPVLNSLLKVPGSLTILLIFPEPDAEAWNKEVSNQDLSSGFITGYDHDNSIMSKELYDVRAIPTLYLLGRDKTVILKDASLEQIGFSLNMPASRR